MHSHSAHTSNICAPLSSPLSDYLYLCVTFVCKYTCFHFQFSAAEYDGAVSEYTAYIKLLKSSGQPPDDVIFCNRAAAYLALARYVPACHDALQASTINPDNWKAFWRHGLSLMAMSKKTFRSKQAIEAFEKCLACGSLPENKRAEVAQELRKAKTRLEEQGQRYAYFLYIVRGQNM